MSSQTIALNVADAGGSLAVTLERRPGNKRVGPFSTDLERSAIAKIWASVARDVRNWVSCRENMRNIGGRLFGATLGASRDSQDLYRETLHRVEKRRQLGHADLLRIAISCGDSEIERLPWEFLFDSARVHVGGGFLGSADYISIRRVGRLRRAGGWASSRPLRLLIVVPTPYLPPVGLRPEDIELPVADTLALNRFIEGLNTRGGSVLETEFVYGSRANPDALRIMLGASFDILYFIGHSRELDGQTWFLLEDGSPLRRGKEISASELASMMATSGIKCVFLSSCESLAAASTLAGFEHLHSVVAMHTEMPVITAGAFDEAVVGAMSVRCSVERAVLRGRQEVCSHIRRLITVEQWEPTERPDWAVPVLYVAEGDRDDGSEVFEDGEYAVGTADGHAAALERCGYVGELPPVLNKCFRQAASRKLRGFSVARCLVTNHQYRYFLEHTHAKKLPRGFRFQGDRIEFGERPGYDGKKKQVRPEDPVTGITRTEADVCCRWFGKRLPKADEYDASAKHGVLVAPESGGVLEWTSDQDKDEDGRVKAVVVGALPGFPHTCLPGFCALRNPDLPYADVGFRMADDLREENADATAHLGEPTRAGQAPPESS